MTTPQPITKEEFEAAAKVQGVTLDWRQMSSFHERNVDGLVPRSSGSGNPWFPNVPSEDAFRLLCAVAKWIDTNRYSEDSEIAKCESAMGGVFAEGAPEAVALATFRLAAEIGRSM